MKKVLLVINGPAYGADETFNAVRLAVALSKRDGTEVKVFLMGDGVTCAVNGQKTPDGYYTFDRMLKGFLSHGGQIACCGTCLDARGLTEGNLIAWAAGNGLEVSGPGEALLMTIAGRPQALDELDGPGLFTLRRRVE